MRTKNDIKEEWIGVIEDIIQDLIKYEFDDFSDTDILVTNRDDFNDRIEEDSSESKMRELVDEIIRDKKDNRGIVKQNEQDMLTNKVEIPDIMELKDVHEKPMVIRKVNSLMDLINKENLHGIELSIVLNHIIDNIDTTSISEEEREIIGDKIKYVKEEK